MQRTKQNEKGMDRYRIRSLERENMPDYNILRVHSEVSIYCTPHHCATSLSLLKGGKKKNVKVDLSGYCLKTTNVLLARAKCSCNDEEQKKGNDLKEKSRTE